MTKWKRLKKGIYYLEGKEHIAIVSRHHSGHWSYGVYDGSVVGLKIKKGALLSRDSDGRARAEMRAAEMLMVIEEGRYLRG